MTHIAYARPPISAMSLIETALISFPVACFTLTAISDVAYIRTLNLLWLHFSEWLLLAGAVFGGVALVVHLIRGAVGHIRFSWLVLLGAAATLVLAIINSFIHTADGWTAVVPWGLTLSLVTIATMIVTGLFIRMEARRV